MKKAIIKPDLCKNCATCLVEANCVNAAIIRESIEDKPWIDFYKCRGCMKCISYCQNNAVGEIIHPCAGNRSKGF
jgi:TPP-dependent indolepyruvate ferredoxin oxidoreductase alpha subunit